MFYSFSYENIVFFFWMIALSWRELFVYVKEKRVSLFFGSVIQYGIVLASCSKAPLARFTK